MNAKCSEIAAKVDREFAERGLDRQVHQYEWEEKFGEALVREVLSYTESGDLDFVKYMIKRNFGVSNE